MRNFKSEFLKTTLFSFGIFILVFLYAYKNGRILTKNRDELISYCFIFFVLTLSTGALGAITSLSLKRDQNNTKETRSSWGRVKKIQSIQYIFTFLHFLYCL